MKRLTREEVRVERLLRAARGVAVLGASARRGQRGNAVVEYLKQAGFDVFPVRQDRAEVAGLASSARLADVPGPIDIVLVLGGDGLDPATIDEAKKKGARALWFAPGVPVGKAEEYAAAHELFLVRNRDIVIEHRHTEQAAGQPRKRGVNVGGRKRYYEDDRKRPTETGYVVGGGGGRKGGGGLHAVLDEKKMVGGRPSPRRGPLRRPE
ncbi:MAG TPA: CoA-binding protein [Candidatus Binatus sp.]|nr:CoA-binding protein [Candidatus Binatus sp.]